MTAVSRLRDLVEIYRAHFRTSIALQFQYRVSLIIWLISTVLEPVIYLVVWSTVARARGGSAGGFTVADFAAYYIIMMLVDYATFTWHMWEYDYRIREGLLSPLLLRPLHPIHGDIAENVAYKVLLVVVIVPTAALLALIFQPALDPPLWALLLFVPAAFLSFLIRFLTGWALAMAAFWTTRIAAVNQMFNVAELFFSGRLAPLSLLPGVLPAIAAVLPFRWTLAFPVELAMGRPSPREAMFGLGVQLIWTALSYILLRRIWRAGVRRYAAFGA